MPIILVNLNCSLKGDIRPENSSIEFFNNIPFLWNVSTKSHTKYGRFVSIISFTHFMARNTSGFCLDQLLRVTHYHLSTITTETNAHEALFLLCQLSTKETFAALTCTTHFFGGIMTWGDEKPECLFVLRTWKVDKRTRCSDNKDSCNTTSTEEEQHMSLSQEIEK